MKAWTLTQFTDVFTGISIDNEDVSPLVSPNPQIISNIFRVWDHDGDGFVGIRDFIHTYAYTQLVSSLTLAHT